MLNIQNKIYIISKLLDENTESSLTYAALECRLTLEHICYERYKLYNKYLCEKDLKGWQPKHVIKQVADEIDQTITESVKVYVAKTTSDIKPSTVQEFEALQYTYLGQQADLNIKNIEKLWHTISNAALHIQVPSLLKESIHYYGEKEVIRDRINEILRFLSQIDGNMILNADVGEVFNFNCFSCGTEIKKPIKAISKNNIVNCSNLECHESYIIRHDDDINDYTPERRHIYYKCPDCEKTNTLAMNRVSKLRFLDKPIKSHCTDCGKEIEISLYPAIHITKT